VYSEARQMPSPPAPLSTPRLTLRPHARADFADSISLWSDPDVTRHIGGRPFTREEIWSRLLRYVGHWAVLGYGYWTVRETASDRFIGEVGFADFQRDLDPSFGDAPEAGWVLAPWSHGKGFATEAVRAALAWADRELRAPRTVCMIDGANRASLRVAEKCGYVEWTRATYKGAEVLLFERGAGTDHPACRPDPS
jgi:RimJ/RimL family protein N-acetyltransferase